MLFRSILIRAWTEQRFSYDGRFWQIDDATVVPRPLQKPHPPILVSGTSDKAYAAAGKNGYGIMIPPVMPYSVVERPLAVYREACAKSGHDPQIIYPKLIYLGSDRAQIRSECGQSLQNFFRYAARGVELISATREELERANYGLYGSGFWEYLATLSYDDIIKAEIPLLGTADEVIEDRKSVV